MQASTVASAGGIDEGRALLIAFGAVGGAGILCAIGYWGIREPAAVLARLLLTGVPAGAAMYFFARYHIAHFEWIGLAWLGALSPNIFRKNMRLSNIGFEITAVAFGAALAGSLRLLQQYRLQEYDWPVGLLLFALLFASWRLVKRSELTSRRVPR
jgi:hypothetical protein